MLQAPLAARWQGLRKTPAATVLVTVLALVLSFWLVDSVKAAPAKAAAQAASPTGSLDAVALSGDGTVSVTGWTVDTDAPTTSLRVNLMDNGRALTTMIANRARPDVAAAHPSYGPAHGFGFRLIDGDGSHQFCVLAINIGGGGNTSLGCSTVTVHNNPTGSMSAPAVSGNTATFTGTATDTNSSNPVVVSGYVDGKHALDSIAAGANHSYTIALPVSEGNHQLCLYAINLGAGSNTQLGCQSILIRNNPFGVLESAGQVPTGLQATGYAIDLNSNSAVSVWAFLDGKKVAQTSAGLPRPDLQSRYPTAGPNHGFSLVIPASAGRHALCLWSINIGPGSNTLLGCSTVTMQNNPIGMLDSGRQLPAGVQLAGWAIDLNSTAALTVKFTVDGRAAGSTHAGLARPDLAKHYPYSGAGHGYSMLLAIGPGRHTVCADAVNLGAGADSRLGCIVVSVQNNPLGALESAYQVPGGLQVNGWALDLNSTGPISVFFYADGRYLARTSAATNRTELATKYPTVGGAHGYSLIAPVGPGRHTVCAYAINTGPGTNSLLRCQTVSLADLPLGRVDSMQQVPGGVQLAGWTMDGFITSPIGVRVYLDGKLASMGTASAARPDLLAHYSNMGAGHGFNLFAPVPAGRHTALRVCDQPQACHQPQPELPSGQPQRQPDGWLDQHRPRWPDR